MVLRLSLLLKAQVLLSSVGCACADLVKVLVTQSRLTLCDLMDCRPPGSSVHRILQARILKWVAISYSRGFSWPRNWTQVSWFVGSLFSIWSTREAQNMKWLEKKKRYFWLSSHLFWGQKILWIVLVDHGLLCFFFRCLPFFWYFPKYFS